MAGPSRPRFSPGTRGHRQRLRLERLESRQLLAWGPQLVADVDVRGESGVFGGRYQSEGVALVTDGVRMYFQGSDGESEGLFVSDGTASGTRRLLANEAETPTRNGSLTPTQGRLYFTRTSQNSSEEIWTSDGTPEGTRFLADVVPDEYYDHLSSLVGWRGRLYFNAPTQGDPGSRFHELWTSDGTPEGTRRVVGASPLPLRGGAWIGTVLDDELYFSVELSGVRQIWRLSDPAGRIELVSELPRTGPEFRTSPPVAVGGAVYIVANVDAGRQGIWRTTGTPQSTELVVDFRPGFDKAEISAPVVWSEQLYFTAALTPRASSGVNSGLFRVDSAGLWGATQVVALDSDPSRHNPPVAAGERIFFYAIDASQKLQLWSSDGTSPGTRPVTEQLPVFTSDPSVPVMVGDRLFFAANDPARGRELWSSNSGFEDVRLVRDIDLGPQGSEPSPVIELHGKAYFAASNRRTGRELWTVSTDGHRAAQIIDLNRDTRSSDADHYLQLGTASLFTTRTYSDGIGPRWSLWSSKGTPETTRRLLGGPEDGIRGEVYESVVVNGTAFFLAAYGYAPPTLWRSDGTVQGTYLLRSLGVENTYFGGWRWSGLESLNGQLYIVYRDRDEDARLFRSDGTRAGTRVSKSLGPSSAPLENVLRSTGQRLLWFDLEPELGSVIYSSDGTERGTERLVVPELRSTFVNQRAWAELDGRGYFTTYRPGVGYELWRTDGTTTGTERLVTFPGSLALRDLVAADQRLYFWIGTGDRSLQLWTSDGTEVGTKAVDGLPRIPELNADIATTTAGDRLWFTYYTSDSGSRLGVSGGTPAGSRLLPLPAFALRRSIFSLEASGSWLYFSFDDGVHGSELWVTDGMPERTRLVTDLVSGPAGSFPKELTNIGGDLYFTADEGRHGREPWVLRRADLGPPELRARLVDYVIWAAQFGQRGVGLAADQDGNGEVGAGDYALWAARLIPPPNPARPPAPATTGPRTSAGRLSMEPATGPPRHTPAAAEGSAIPEKSAAQSGAGSAVSTWLETLRSRRR